MLPETFNEEEDPLEIIMLPPVLFMVIDKFPFIALPAEFWANSNDDTELETMVAPELKISGFVSPILNLPPPPCSVKEKLPLKVFPPEPSWLEFPVLLQQNHH